MALARIGITVNEDFSGFSAVNAMKVLSENYPQVSSEFFLRGVDYMSNGLGFEGTPLDHQSKINSLVTEFFSIYDGLIVPGSNPELDPIFYAECPLPKDDPRFNSNHVVIRNWIDLNGSDKNHQRRAAVEIALIRAAVARGVPTLGLCGGHQLIGVAFGNKLCELGNIRDRSIQIVVLKNHQLHTLAQGDIHRDADIIVRAFSAHSKMIDNSKKLPAFLVVSAIDGCDVIKAIEANGNHPFFFGAQFHPECQVSNLDKKIFDVFVDSSIDVKKNKKKMKKVLTHLGEASLKNPGVVKPSFVDKFTGEESISELQNLKNGIGHASLIEILKKMPIEERCNLFAGYKIENLKVKTILAIFPLLPENYFSKLLAYNVNEYTMFEIISKLPKESRFEVLMGCWDSFKSEELLSRITAMLTQDQAFEVFHLYQAKHGRQLFRMFQPAPAVEDQSQRKFRCTLI